MTFGPRNAYYLRISTNTVLPLFLYLDERHIEWMSDIVLQHVLADLRPLIIPKLRAERDVHFGPGTAPGNKRGTVDVRRGETYQFAYFFRKTEPHTVLFKSRHFVTAPISSQTIDAKSASSRLADRNPQKKRSRTRASTVGGKRKRVKTNKGKNRAQSHLDEDEWPAEDSEDDMDDADLIPREPRPVRRRRHTVINAYREDDDGNTIDIHQDVTMSSPSPETDGGSTEVLPVADDGDTVTSDENNLLPDVTDIDLAVEEEEEKPKPLLKLKYQSFPVAGHCLCVVVEPWPSLRAELTPSSHSLGTAVRPGRLEPSHIPSDESVIAGQRAKTPLFFPEYDRALSEAPFARERILPPVPLFHDAVSRTEDDDDNDDLMNFSQTLNAVGHMHALAADDDDDMDGAILFGDADEVRELF